jgi:hypothetical protein
MLFAKSIAILIIQRKNFPRPASSVFHEVIVFPKLVQILVDFVTLRNVLDSRGGGLK